MAASPLYRHSGKISFLSVLAGAGAAFVVGPTLATIYAVAIAYIPIIYLNMLLTGAFGAAVGFSVAFAMKMGKSRNNLATLGVAFLATCFAHYVGWMVWVAVMCFRAEVEVPLLAILFPPTFLQMVVGIGQEGVWTLGRSDTPVSGILLWIVWILEAAIVFGASLFVSFATADSEPFCESCQSWCKADNQVLRLTGYADSAAMKDRLLGQDVAVLAEASAVGADEQTWHQVDLCLCEQCGATNTLTLAHVTQSYDKKGNAQQKAETLVDRLLVSAEQAGWVRGLARPSAQPAMAYAGELAP